ncbi:hypothetical protein PHJA_002903100 [Phtheirospermum japonicum]|uniref:Mitochondrial transcription termination factor n=1 Tax=Phtheirospermum japonicum TaxID=374723 RepID=A0A830D8L4_9LAMI|nr:hypothetical protein PHJA_002903100 [Phtheirospermum japonicum]
MFAILCRSRLRFRVTPTDCNYVAQQFRAAQNAVLVRACSTSVCENVSQKKPFTVSSYLINSCGLSSNDAVSASKKLCRIKSPEKPDAVLKLLRQYGFADAHISRLVIKWPNVLLASPNKTLLPKLEFFVSIGVPLPVLARNLSGYPYILWRSLKNSIIPSYNDLKTLLGSDTKVVNLFKCNLRTFVPCLAEGVVSMLRERGMPESSIVSLVIRKPLLLITNKEKLAAHFDRAIGMGFDVSKGVFVDAIQVFVSLGESNLKQKMEVYSRCGWSESGIITAFLKHPMCMTLSEEKITATMDFLVNTLGCEPAAIAQSPVLVCLSLEKRIKPRCLVARILNEKMLKNKNSVAYLLMLSEAEFLKRYIVKYEKDIPELFDIYRGKSSPPEMFLSQPLLNALYVNDIPELLDIYLGKAGMGFDRYK